jgi:hypothetical protein
MDERQTPKFAYQYFPTGKRNVDPPRNRRTGQKTMKAEQAWLGYTLFLLMTVTVMAAIKSKYKTLARMNKLVLLPFYPRYRMKAYIKPTTYSKETETEILTRCGNRRQASLFHSCAHYSSDNVGT